MTRPPVRFTIDVAAVTVNLPDSRQQILVSRRPAGLGAIYRSVVTAGWGLKISTQGVSWEARDRVEAPRSRIDDPAGRSTTTVPSAWGRTATI